MNKGSYEIISGSIGSFVPNPWRTVYSASNIENLQQLNVDTIY